MEERRKFKRLAISIPIALKMREANKPCFTKAFLFDAKNIGEAGLFLNTSIKYKKGKILLFNLILKKNLRPISIKGEVIWSTKKDKRYNTYSGVGIKFVEISQKDSIALKKFINNKIKSYKDAKELKSMYLKLKGMAARLVELEERHSTASRFKKVIDKAIKEIDNIAHLIDREIVEVKNL